MTVIVEKGLFGAPTEVHSVASDGTLFVDPDVYKLGVASQQDLAKFRYHSCAKACCGLFGSEHHPECPFREET